MDKSAILAVAAGILVVSMAAHPAVAQWYVNGSLGAQLLEDRSETAFGVVETFSFDPGIAGNLAVGYRFASDIRVEAEAGYTRSDFSSVSLLGTKVALSGNVDSYSFTLNGFKDIPTGTFVTPYLGGGVGVAAPQINDLTALGIDFGSTTRRANLTWLVEGGLALKVSEHVSVIPAYRYQRIVNDGTDVLNTTSHIFKLGLRYSF